MNTNLGPPVVLLVEDNPDDVRLVHEAFRENKVRCKVVEVADGRQALAYLKGEPPFAGRPRPDLILLDLNLPAVDGRQVLSVVKGDPGLMTIPVVVLTTSSSPEDVDGSYRRHCNAYVVKPIDFDDFADVIGKLRGFWLEAAELPGPAKGV
jgi:two-component system, chemotaxis family, response regulator Rcp1